MRAQNDFGPSVPSLESVLVPPTYRNLTATRDELASTGTPIARLVRGRVRHFLCRFASHLATDGNQFVLASHVGWPAGRVGNVYDLSNSYKVSFFPDR
jgi:hypothetical protein